MTTQQWNSVTVRFYCQFNRLHQLNIAVPVKT